MTAREQGPAHSYRARNAALAGHVRNASFQESRMPASGVTIFSQRLILLARKNLLLMQSEGKNLYDMT